MRQGKSSKSRRRPSRTTRTKPLASRLGLEALEVRVVPSTLPHGTLIYHGPTGPIAPGNPHPKENWKPTLDPGNDGESATAAGATAAAALPNGSVSLGTNFDGLHFVDQPCGCLPPDNGFAVGNGFVVEAVNASEVRISNMAGTPLLTQEMSSFMGLGSHGDGGDPFVVYDDIANRWYMLQLDGAYSGIEFAWSNDANPLDGFHSTFINLGYLIDFPKMGFNADDVVITGNAFNGTTYPVQIIAIDKSALLGGSFSGFIYDITGYPTNWGLMPAKMHGAAPGSPNYFVDEAGFGSGSAIRSWSITGLLTGTATANATDLAVNAYGEPVNATQPGGGGIATNNAWLISADWRDDVMATAHNATTPGDGGHTTHAIWYEVNTNGGGTPTLKDQGVISSGAGVHSYMPSVALDANGDLGITYIESSAGEFMSMWVGIHAAGAPAGTTATTVAKQSTHTLVDNSRSGDYSNTVVDPSNPNTFWSSNEYSPAGSNTDIWATYVASYTVGNVSGSADMSVTMTGKKRAQEGGKPVYTITVHNNGPDPATGVIVTDTFGALFNFLTATATQGSFFASGNTVVFNVGSMASGATVTLTVTLQGNEDGSTNNAVAVVADQSDPNSSNNSASVAVTLVEPPITVSAPITTTQTTLNHVQTATFHHAGGVEPASAFTATIDWGDGSSSTGTITKVGKTYHVYGSHTYTDGQSSHTITTHVVENGSPPNAPAGADLARQLVSASGTAVSSAAPVSDRQGVLNTSDASTNHLLDLYFNGQSHPAVVAPPDSSAPAAVLAALQSSHGVDLNGLVWQFGAFTFTL